MYTSKHTAETSGVRVAGTTDELASINREVLEKTTTLSIRIPIRHRLIYDKLTHKEKYYFKLGVLALLEALGRGREGGEGLGENSVLPEFFRATQGRPKEAPTGSTVAQI